MSMKRHRSLDEILENFKASAGGPNTGEPRASTTISIWLSVKDKERYLRLQQMSGRKFSKKVRETLMELIELAEERAAS